MASAGFSASQDLEFGDMLLPMQVIEDLPLVLQDTSPPLEPIAQTLQPPPPLTITCGPARTRKPPRVFDEVYGLHKTCSDLWRILKQKKGQTLWSMPVWVRAACVLMNQSTIAPLPMDRVTLDYIAGAKTFTYVGRYYAGRRGWTNQGLKGVFVIDDMRTKIAISPVLFEMIPDDLRALMAHAVAEQRE